MYYNDDVLIILQGFGVQGVPWEKWERLHHYMPYSSTEWQPDGHVWASLRLHNERDPEQ